MADYKPIKKPMGADESTPNYMGASNRPYGCSSYVTVSGQRMLSDRTQSFVQSNSSKPKDSAKKCTYLPPYYGVWSIAYPECICPASRHSQASCYDPNTNTLFIAYGTNKNNDPLNDCWALSIDTMTWTRIQSELLSPRFGCSSIFVDGLIYVIGGEHDGQFFRDLHTINPTNGEVTVLETSGNAPAPRRNPVMGAWDNKLYVWGGANDHHPTELYILDMETMTWRIRTETNVIGRSAAAFVQDGQYVWVFGSTRSQGLIRLNMETEQFEALETFGTAAPITATEAVLLKIGDLLVTFGGSTAGFSRVHAYDPDRNWWSVLDIRPDGDTLTADDGATDTDGMFALPDGFGYAAAFDPSSRRIICTMGSNAHEPPPVSVIDLGDAIGSLNMQKDMLEAMTL